ncbi:MAG TPA: DMT family transporter [Thermoanaerobaculia bacterium]|nr:DMT family transporter [Thermoanaerobaculia bacterium]
MNPDRGTAATLIEAFVAVALFGCIPVLVKLVSANAWTIGVVRLSVATLGLFILLRVRERIPRLAGPDLARLALIGFLFFGHWLTYFLAIKASSASIGAIGLSTYGVYLLILGAAFGHGRLHAVDVIAVLMAIAGAVAIVPGFDLSDDVTVGMLLATLSAFLYATLPILHQRWSHMPSRFRALGQFSFALLFFLLFLPKTEWDLSARDWGGLAFLAIGSTLIGHSLWVGVTTRLSPYATSILYYGNLPIAILLSIAVLGEALRPRTVLGAILIMGGSLLGLGSQWRRNALESRK